MTRILLVCICVLPSYAVCAQSTDEREIKKVIEQIFTGMLNSDSALVRGAFTNDITLATAARNKTNDPILHRESSLDGFLQAVGTPKKERWHEEFWNLKIQIDGDFASAWCDYAFYLGKTFSHCGVDAFHLHRTPDGWKVFHLTDTRRKEPCDIPAEIKAKYQ
jgi:hypothetical protein